ncbi:hypothetical protein CYMTET_23469 [Cymbomonas tetramitiformis]|uniref:Uncharacterized protein n=1 Tax=Cymbomonas tetramitiformis TaxID=36881 RepID=A0AAE0FYF4_9CHLO|nr:hypothetical protein CYMTET_23469 [Cymbomonas tetramitiformis]|eukprot:gene18038-21482_t
MAGESEATADENALKQAKERLTSQQTATSSALGDLEKWKSPPSQEEWSKFIQSQLEAHLEACKFWREILPPAPPSEVEILDEKLDANAAAFRALGMKGRRLPSKPLAERKAALPAKPELRSAPTTPKEGARNQTENTAEDGATAEPKETKSGKDDAKEENLSPASSKDAMRRRSLTMGAPTLAGIPGAAKAGLPGMGGMGGMGGINMNAELKGLLKKREGGPAAAAKTESSEGRDSKSSNSSQEKEGSPSAAAAPQPAWMLNLKSAKSASLSEKPLCEKKEATAEKAKPSWMVELEKKRAAKTAEAAGDKKEEVKKEEVKKEEVKKEGEK